MIVTQSFSYKTTPLSDGCLLCVTSATREIKFPFKLTWQLLAPYTYSLYCFYFAESAHQEVSSSLKLKHDINHQNVFNDALIHIQVYLYFQPHHCQFLSAKIKMPFFSSYYYFLYSNTRYNMHCSLKRELDNKCV